MIEDNLDRLKKWSTIDLMRFNKDRCEVLHLGFIFAYNYSVLGNECLCCSSAEKDLGIW